MPFFQNLSHSPYSTIPLPEFHHNHHNNTLLTYLSPAQNVEYYQCTYADSPVPWCATGTDSTGTVIPNQWGDCVVSQVTSRPIPL